MSTPESPDFRVGIDTVGAHLDSLMPAEHFNFEGIKKTVNGTAARTIGIVVTNGKHVPSDDQTLRALGMSMATYVKSQLKDTSEYDLYDVRFDTRKNSNGVTSSSFNTIEFKSYELR